MAKGNSTGGRGLNLTAKLDVAEAIRAAQALKKEMAGIAGVSSSGGAKAFDVKPLSEYQAGLLKIKQDALDLAKKNTEQATERRNQLDSERKAKQEQAAADKSASLATQAALKEEARIKREAIALAKEQAKETERLAKIARQNAPDPKPYQANFAPNPAPTNFLNPTKDLLRLLNEEYKKGTIGLKEYEAESLRLKAIIAEKDGVMKSSLGTTNTDTGATKLSTTAKKELALQNAILKLSEQEAAAALKNSARERNNDKGSLEQRRAALIRLTAVYDRLNKAERESAAGKRLEGIVRGLVGQISTLEQATGRAQRGVGGYADGIAAFFKSIGQNILSTLGPLALLTAAWASAKAAFSHNVEISDNFTDVQRTAKLSADEVDRLGDQLKKINTRTNLEGLLDIGFEGGRLGVQKDELVDFITTVDKLSVVLKKELPGGAEAVATSLGKIVKIYKIAENEGISLGDAMNKVGSSQLELAHSGGVTVKYLQDFTLGVAGTAVSSKLSLPVIEAYGAVMSNAGTIASSASISLTRLVNDLSVKRGKYFAIAQLADSTLTVEKFNKLINTDTQAALSLFFKGLKAGNPTQIEFAERIKSVGITTGKVSNAVKVLANNYDLLQGKLEIGTKGYEEATSVNHNFELANNSLAASFDKIKNGIVNYFTSSENGRALAGLLNSFTDTRVESEKLSEEYIENKKQLDELETVLKPLTDRYDELQKKVKQVGGVSKLTKVDQDDLRDVTARIGEILPGVTTKFDEFGNSIAISRDRIRELTKAQRELLIAQNRKGIDQANDDFKESQRKATAQLKIVKDLAANVGQQYGRKEVTNKVVQDANDYAKVLVGQSYAAAKALVSLGGTLDANQKKVVDYYEGIDKAKKKPKDKQEVLGTGELADETETVRTTEVIKAEIKALQDADKKLAITSDDFKANIAKIKDLRKELRIALGGKDTEGIKTENEYQVALKSRNSLQAKISELTKKGTDKQLSADVQELESVRDKYAKMRAEAIKFNNDPKNKAKGLKVNAGGLLVAQDREETGVRDKQDTDKLKVTLDEQKKLYDDYEEYKTKVGKEEADKRYGTLIEKDETYLESLKTKRDALTNPQKSKGGSDADVAATQLQVKLLDEQIAAEVQVQQKKYDDLIASLLTYEEERKAKTQQYNADMAELEKTGTADQKAQRTKLYKEQLNELDDSHVQSLDAYKALFDGIDQLSEENARKVIANARVMLDGLVKSGKISKELAKQIKIQLKESTAAVDDKLPQNLINIAQQIDGIASSVQGVDASFAELLSTLGNVLGQVGNIKKGIADFNVAKGKGDSLGQLSAGLGIVGAGFSAFQSIAKFFNTSARREEQEAYNRGIQNKQTEALNKSLERQVQLLNDAYGTDRLIKYNEAIKQATENEKKYQDQLKTRLQLTGDKTLDDIITKLNNGEKVNSPYDIIKIRNANDAGLLKTLPDDIEALQRLLDEGKLDANTATIVQNLIQAKKTAEDLANTLRAENVGSSLDNIADDFISTLTDGTQDFGKTFEETIRKSIINGFKQKLIEEQLQPFYKTFADLSKDGLTKDEIETLRLAYVKASEKANQAADDLEKITGVDIKKPVDPTGISGKIVGEALTEGTANRMLGITQAQHDTLKATAKVTADLYRATIDNFQVNVQIAANTLRTANNTEALAGMSVRLDEIAANTKSSSTSSIDQKLRDAGVK